MWDHPRACGEHTEYEILAILLRGSSPRMRGTPHQQLAVRYRVRIIPAHAGNTLMHCRALSVSRDHPRACGEHIDSPTGHIRSVGSSPRMRGTPARDRCQHHRAGIIPAHAGNTGQWMHKLPNGRDHPRACGEHLQSAKLVRQRLGSSPRMRGTPYMVSHPCRLRGIIPAHAGNTRAGGRSIAASRDHPRACGEHGNVELVEIVHLGSSPRMRGTRRNDLNLRVRKGIIPAHAGNTCVVSFGVSCWWDHPRACGEHYCLSVTVICRLGSSPRMRGTHGHATIISGMTGIIPAHAGNTFVARRSSLAAWDHPRACGEHSTHPCGSYRERGSSPRMRGTHLHKWYVFEFGGIIPAHAGNTVFVFLSVFFVGIIPAHAGNTRCSLCCCCSRRDHPRACGEHPGISRCSHTLPGSSPRMRGTQRSCHYNKRYDRDHPRACGEHMGVA